MSERTRESVPGDVGDSATVLPLTAAQRGMWFAENLSADYSVNIAQYVDIRHDAGGFAHDLFATCVLDAGKALQSPYVRLTEMEDGAPAQVVDLDLPITCDILDFGGEADPEAAAQEWMRADYQRPIDLRADQLVVSVLLRLSPERTLWYTRGHHIVIDGYAALTMVRMTVDRYNAARRGIELDERPAATLAEIVADEQKYRESSRFDADREHWRGVMAELPERVTLSRRPSSTGLAPQNIVAGGVLPLELQERIEALAAELGSSVAMVLAAAYGAFLYRMTGIDDVLLSLPVTGRATAKIKRAGGMLSNILPVRIDGLEKETVADLIRSVQVEMTGALRHQRFRSDDIRRDAGLDADVVGFGPTINMVFFDEPIAIDGATADYRILASGILEDLLVNLYQSSPGAPLVVDLHGNTYRYTQDEMDSHHRRFLTFAEAFVTDPAVPVRDLPILLPGEEGALREFERGPAREYGGEHILDRFLAQVRMTPDAVAVCDGDDEYTYAEFDALRSATARILRANGVGVGDRVAIMVERGVAQVAAVYAAVTLGAAYLPIDPGEPEQRRDAVLAAANPVLVVDDEFLAAGFSPSAMLAEPAFVELVEGRGSAPYVIFTSGSTGTPKGVEVGMAAVNNRLAWMREDHPLSPSDAVLYKTPITFDVSVGELFGPLQMGARMVIAAPGGHRDPEYLRTVMVERSVTVTHFVPSMLDVFLEAVRGTAGASDRMPGSLRRIITSGEALSRELAARVGGYDGIELLNLYGPTEAAVEVTAHEVGGGADGGVPIGRPVANTDILVLDSQLRRAPIGAAGEMYLGGVQLAHGYVGQAGLTAERFVAHPEGRGERLYRTGDLVRWREDGDLEYLGRADFQVKIRGQRVELGEIESVLLQDPDVDAAVAVVRELDLGTSVVAYVRVAKADEGLTRRLEKHCAAVLPAHMVPAAVVALDEFPTTSSGKLDRRSLPEPAVVERSPAVHVPPVSDVEKKIAGRIEEILGVQRVGLADNLFALGADSLAAARLATALRVRDGLIVPLAEIFLADDVAALAGAADDSGPTPQPRLVAMERPDSIPVSVTQTRLWFVNRLDPESAAYNMPGAVRLGSDVDLEALKQAIVDVVIRHEVLRTRFVGVDGEPTQIIDPVKSVDVDSAITVVETDDMDSAVAATAAAGFDLAEGAFRAVLLRAPEATVLVVVLHHIIGDGASLRPLIGDVVTAYTARRHGFAPFFPALPVQYVDYALWQRELLGDADDVDSLAHRELAFWATELKGAPEVLALPADRPRPRTPSGRGGFVDLELPSTTVDAVHALAAHAGVTAFSVIQAALAVLLARLADTDDVVVGTAVARREEPEVADLVGMFVNTVALRTRVRPDQDTIGLLHEVHAGRARALSNATAPFEQVVDVVAHTRTLSHSPIFQVALTMQDDAFGAATESDLGAELVTARVPAAKYDLSVTAVQHPGDGGGYGPMAVEFSYATDLYDHSSTERLALAFQRVLDGMLAAPAEPVGRIEVLSAETISRLTAAPAPIAEPTTLRAVVLDWLAAGRARSEAALLSGETTLSARAASSRINQLARELISRGAGPGTTVAVSAPRSVESVVAILATALTGSAYVYVDPAFPSGRRKALIDDCAAVVGISTAPVDAVAAGGRDWIVLGAEATELHLAGHPSGPVGEGELVAPLHLDAAAYLIYTSGSTGTPKAVSVTHRGLAGLVDNQRSMLGLDATSVVLHAASPSFDATVFELTMAVGSGARLVVADTDSFADTALEQVIAAGPVTHAVMTPSVLGTLNPAAVPTLTTVLSAGEACPPDLAHSWVQARRSFWNLYGPTEFTIWATAERAVTGTPITIGRSVPGAAAYVLDNALRPAPDGVVGELYLAGEQLARGYLGRPDLTAVSFVANPFRPGGRLYRTGDRVTRQRDGKLIYHGRSDFQLKIRGMRIEPAEVDAVFMAHPSVANALTLGLPGPAGDPVLVSYVSPRRGHTITEGDLVAHARDRLPSHLVPSAVTVVDEFPRTSIGKIDRDRLPSPQFAQEAVYVAPRTELEATVATVLAEVLGTERLSIVADFFDQGGNSLSAAKVAARLTALLETQVRVAEVFDAPTVELLAARLTDGRTGRPTLPLTAMPRAAVVPVSAVQRGIWLINRSAPESSAYNLPLALRLRGALDAAALRRALADVIDRHESLRTVYPMINGTPVQMIQTPEMVMSGLDLTVEDLAGSRPGEVEERLVQLADAGFDVTDSVPVRAGLIRTAAHEHVFLLVVHHIGVDGASLVPLAADLMAAYAARCGGQAPQWEPLRLQPADYAQWQLQRMALVGPDGVTEREFQLDYWKRRLEGAPQLLELPTDRPRPPVRTGAGGVVDFAIPAELADGLAELARAQSGTLFMVTQTALSVLLSRLSGQTDIVVGTPYAGRGAEALDEVVGMFVNTVALRTRIDPAQPFTELLQQVRGDTLADLANTDVAFEEVVSALGRGATMGYSPLFQVMFTFQNLAFPQLELAGLTVEPESVRTGRVQNDLGLTLFPNDPMGADSGGAMRGSLSYAGDLFDETTVRRFIEWYLAVLEAIVDDPSTAVGDFSLEAAAPAKQVELDSGTALPLPLAVVAAAESAPERVGAEVAGIAVTIGQLAEASAALAAVLPDSDGGAALTTALFSALPGLAAGGPAALDDVLTQLRRTCDEVLQPDHHILRSVDGETVDGPAGSRLDLRRKP